MEGLANRVLEWGQNTCEAISNGLDPIVRAGDVFANDLRKTGEAAFDLPSDAFAPSLDGLTQLPPEQEIAVSGIILSWMVSGLVSPVRVAKTAADLGAWSLAVTKMLF